MKRVEQAGSVVFRRVGDRVEILLVRSKKNPEIWVFPKGHIERGETAADTAAREAREEAGVEGNMLSPIGRPLEFMSGAEPVRVQYFLMQATRMVPADEDREKRWFNVEEARDSLSFDSARGVLAAAAAAITAMTAKS